MSNASETVAAAVTGSPLVPGQGVSVLYSDGATYNAVLATLGRGGHTVRWMPADGGGEEIVPSRNVSSLPPREEVKVLVAWIRAAKVAYYNTGNSLISDADYDVVEDRLKVIDPNNPILKTVGAPVGRTSREKVKLPLPMRSLDKVKPDTADAWLANHPGPWLISDKIDGISIQITCGSQPAAYTRGDGVIGQDISHLIQHLRLPDLKKIGAMTVRGEIVMPRAKFAGWAAQFENARNLAAGVVNRMDIHPATAHLDVLCYEIMSPRSVPSAALAKLKTLGFKVVANKVYKAISAEQLGAMLKARRQSGHYEVDGLVVLQDKSAPLAVSSNPSYAVAFKQTDDSDVTQSEVVSVEWNASRHGYLKPTVLIKPVRLAGVTVSRATGFNAQFIRDKRIGPGAVVKITRSGDVIPHIMDVVTQAAKPSMPVGVKAVWKGTDLVLHDATADSNVALQRIVHFFSYIGVEGFKEGVAAKLWAAGLDTILKVVHAPVSKMTTDGVGSATAQKLHQAIRTQLAACTLTDIMVASGAFGRGIGERRVKSVARNVPSLRGLLNLPPDRISSKVAAMPGWSNDTAHQFAMQVPGFLAFLARLPVQPQPEAKAPIGGRLKGVTVVFTGFRDMGLESTIESLGGQLGSNVGPTTTVLVVKDKNTASGKAVKAKQLGIPVMGADEFRKAYRITA